MAHHSFTTEQAATGWKTQQREHFAYWVPEVDIKGSLPNDLVGTFFRNGKKNWAILFLHFRVTTGSARLLQHPLAPHYTLQCRSSWWRFLTDQVFHTSMDGIN
jgi:hypothetical protein